MSFRGSAYFLKLVTARMVHTHCQHSRNMKALNPTPQRHFDGMCSDVLIFHSLPSVTSMGSRRVILHMRFSACVELNIYFLIALDFLTMVLLFTQACLFLIHYFKRILINIFEGIIMSYNLKFVTLHYESKQLIASPTGVNRYFACKESM